jgi:hypothetical protein
MDKVNDLVQKWVYKNYFTYSVGLTIILLAGTWLKGWTEGFASGVFAFFLPAFFGGAAIKAAAEAFASKGGNNGQVTGV